MSHKAINAHSASMMNDRSAGHSGCGLGKALSGAVLLLRGTWFGSVPERYIVVIRSLTR